MKFVCLIVIAGVISCAYSDDDCAKQFKTVYDCLKKNREDNKDADKKKIDDGKNAIRKCFTDNGCKGPDYNKDEMRIEDVENELNFGTKYTFTAVKDCLKKLYQKVATNNVNKCLKEKNVKPMTDVEVSGMDLKSENGSRPELDDRLVKARFQVIRALKQCEKDKDAKTREAAETCIEPLKEAADADMCKRVDDCKQDSTVSDECNKRRKEIKDALCQCKQDQFVASRGKIKDLQKRGGDVDLDQIQKAMPEDLKNVDFDLMVLKNVTRTTMR